LKIKNLPLFLLLFQLCRVLNRFYERVLWPNVVCLWMVWFDFVRWLRYWIVVFEIGDWSFVLVLARLCWVWWIGFEHCVVRLVSLQVFCVPLLISFGTVLKGSKVPQSGKQFNGFDEELNVIDGLEWLKRVLKEKGKKYWTWDVVIVAL